MLYRLSMRNRWRMAALVLPLALRIASAGESLPFGALNVVHWGVEDGLAPGPINTMIQTRDGYLWFGSDDGLARFDGVRARVFDSRNKPAFKSSRISALCEDQRGALWIGTKGGGVLRFSDGRFTPYTRDNGLENEQVTEICEDRSGTIWVGTDGGGLFRFVGGRFARWKPVGMFNDPFINSLAADREGAVYVGSHSGLQRILGDTVETFTTTNGLATHDVAALYCDAKGAMWIGGRDGVLLFEDGHFRKPAGTEPMGQVESILGAADGSMWIGTAYGLYHLKGERTARYSIEDGLSGKIAACLLADREGSLWVGNEANGADQLRTTRFTVYSARQGLTHEITTSIYQDEAGSVWIGSHNGLNRLRDGRITQFTTRNGLSGDLVLSVCGDHEGGIWVGTLSGLSLLKEGKFRIYTARDGLPSKAIWCIYCDRQGTVWVGTHDGLVKVVEGRLKVFNYDNAGLSHNDVRAICEDHEGNLWVGTSYGLNRLRGDRFEHFITPAPGLALEIVYALYADDAGALWIGTADHGLVRYKDGKFIQYSSKDGLFDNSVFQILEDGQQNLWMTCDHGIFRIPKAQLNAFAEGRITNVTSTVFGKADGLLSTECSGSIQPAGWKGNDGRLWFPTSRGAAVIDPRVSFTNEVGPPVLVEGITVDGKEMPFSTNVVVAPGGEQVQVNYTALSFVVPRQVRFKYQLAGLDHDWIDAGARRVAYYPHLPPGRYQFKVIACNNDGVWNQSGATLGLTMEPFFWQTKTFRLSLALSAIMATGLLVWRITLTRHRRQLAALERQHALELERSRIARDMHDGVGASLVKISLLGEIVEGQLTGPNQGRDQVHKMTVAARDAVRDMDEIVWAVNPKNDTLENLANYICQFAREHFTDTPVQCHLDVPVELPPLPLTAEIRHNLFLAIKEALNNVLKHARASQVRLTMELNGSVLRILVEDDGRGCSSDEIDRFGNGLENMRRRLTDLGGRLEWTTRPGKGTAIRMILRLDGQPESGGV